MVSINSIQTAMAHLQIQNDGCQCRGRHSKSNTGLTPRAGDLLRFFNASVVAVLLSLICCGCYPRAVSPVDIDGKRSTWAEMGFLQRKEHMSREILPRAAAFFGAWRPERFANVDCGLCHGLEYLSGNFNMPAATLPRLSGELLLGPEFAKEPETTRLKLDRLVPMMTEALGVRSFSIVTRTGFGCYSCHLGPTGAKFGN